MFFSDLKEITGFPCLSCPFLIALKRNSNVYPSCSIYSNNNVGLESCEEVANFVKENWNTKMFIEHFETSKGLLVFN